MKSFEKFQESMLKIINEAMIVFPAPLNIEASNLVSQPPSIKDFENIFSYLATHDSPRYETTKYSLEELLKKVESELKKDKKQLFEEKISAHEFLLAKTSVGKNLSKEELRSFAESKMDQSAEEIKSEHNNSLDSTKKEIVELIAQLDDYESKMESLKYTLIFLHSEGYLKTINIKGKHYTSNLRHATRVDPTVEGRIYNNLEEENFILTSKSLAILNKSIGKDKKPLYKTINEWVESAFTLPGAVSTTTGLVSTFLGG